MESLQLSPNTARVCRAACGRIGTARYMHGGDYCTATQGHRGKVGWEAASHQLRANAITNLQIIRESVISEFTRNFWILLT